MRERERERPGRSNSYAEAKKMKSVTIPGLRVGYSKALCLFFFSLCSGGLHAVWLRVSLYVYMSVYLSLIGLPVGNVIAV